MNNIEEKETSKLTDEYPSGLAILHYEIAGKKYRNIDKGDEGEDTAEVAGSPKKNAAPEVGLAMTNKEDAASAFSVDTHVKKLAKEFAMTEDEVRSVLAEGWKQEESSSVVSGSEAVRGPGDTRPAASTCGSLFTRRGMNSAREWLANAAAKRREEKAKKKGKKAGAMETAEEEGGAQDEAAPMEVSPKTPAVDEQQIKDAGVVEEHVLFAINTMSSLAKTLDTLVEKGYPFAKLKASDEGLSVYDYMGEYRKALNGGVGVLHKMVMPMLDMARSGLLVEREKRDESEKADVPKGAGAAGSHEGGAASGSKDNPLWGKVKPKGEKGPTMEKKARPEPGGFGQIMTARRSQMIMAVRALLDAVGFDPDRSDIAVKLVEEAKLTDFISGFDTLAEILTVERLYGGSAAEGTSTSIARESLNRLKSALQAAIRLDKEGEVISGVVFEIEEESPFSLRTCICENPPTTIDQSREWINYEIFTLRGHFARLCVSRKSRVGWAADGEPIYRGAIIVGAIAVQKNPHLRTDFLVDPMEMRETNWHGVRLSGTQIHPRKMNRTVHMARPMIYASLGRNEKAVPKWHVHTGSTQDVVVSPEVYKKIVTETGKMNYLMDVLVNKLETCLPECLAAGGQVRANAAGVASAVMHLGHERLYDTLRARSRRDAVIQLALLAFNSQPNAREFMEKSAREFDDACSSVVSEFVRRSVKLAVDEAEKALRVDEDVEVAEQVSPDSPEKKLKVLRVRNGSGRR